MNKKIVADVKASVTDDICNRRYMRDSFIAVTTCNAEERPLKNESLGLKKLGGPHDILFGNLVPTNWRNAEWLLIRAPI